MSLAEKWKEFCLAPREKARLMTWEDMREAFYAGAEATLTEEYKSGKSDFEGIAAEIDHFRSRRGR